jgi:hypothetical protein
MSQKPLNATLSVMLGTLVGVVFFIGGYYLLSVDGQHEAYGLVMFLLVPCVSGFAVGAVARRGTHAAACLVLTLILGLSLMIVVGLEGWICCLMALPLLLAGLAVGALLGYFVRGRFLDHGNHAGRNTLLLLLACPFLMAAANQAEKPWRNQQRSETFVSEVFVPKSPTDTWNMLVRMPSMDGVKPFLLRIGLPVPYRCTLDADAVGGQRTCYFDQGVIEMEVTDWQRPEKVGMKITKSTLPGRRWLTFVDAHYTVVPEANGTRVIRQSTIASRLYPRWYWRPFEAWGVTSEHEFVLSSLAVAAAD